MTTTTTTTLSQIDELRDMRDRLAVEIAGMPGSKRESKWHLDRHAELTRINRKLRKLIDSMFE